MDKEELKKLVAEKIFGLTDLGYPGPPKDPTVEWTHINSCLYPTQDEAKAAYEKYHKHRYSDGHKQGILDIEDFDSSLCYWQEGWGPLVVPDVELYDAFNVIENMRNRGRIFQCSSTIESIEKAATAGLPHDENFGPYEVRFQKFECSECGRCHESWCNGYCTRTTGEFAISVFTAALKSMGISVKM